MTAIEKQFMIGVQSKALSPSRPPCAIRYIPSNTSEPILIESGFGPYDEGGALLSPKEALDPRWYQYFRDANALWFLELVRLMSAGTTVTIEQISAEHKKATGRSLLTLAEWISENKAS
jgi:hypothetical protein